MKQTIILRLSAILWVWLIGMCGSLPTMAQFDEPSRNQWFVDASFGLGDKPTVPELSYDGHSLADLGLDWNAQEVYKYGLSFGVNRRLFHNFYAGVRLGYKYSHYKAYGRLRISSINEYLDIKLNYHIINLPIEFGYNHTYSNRSGLNIYAAVQPGYCVSSGVSQGSEYSRLTKYFSFSNPGLCLDCAAGLRYFIRHVSIGAAYHHPLNNGQKKVGSEYIELSLGYRF